MSDEHPQPDELDAELEQLSAEPLRVETIDPVRASGGSRGSSRGSISHGVVERDET